MNALTPTVPATRATARSDFLTGVNEWRGHAIHLYAEAEDAIARCLLTLNKAEPGYKLPHLGGQKSAALRAAIGVGCPLAPLARALAAYAQVEAHRSLLCHATAKIEDGQEGRWRLRLHLVGDHADRCRTVEQDDAEHLLTDLKSAVRSLRLAANQLR